MQVTHIRFMCNLRKSSISIVTSGIYANIIYHELFMGIRKRKRKKKIAEPVNVMK